jgi:hypothetical protein
MEILASPLLIARDTRLYGGQNAEIRWEGQERVKILAGANIFEIGIA